MEKIFGSFQDLIVFARERGFNLDEYYTKKEEDIAKLKKLNLPQPDTFSCSYNDFRQDNMSLTEFLERHSKFFIRARPTIERLEKGYTFGLKTFKEMKEFVDPIVADNKGHYTIIISEWDKDMYGGVIVFERGMKHTQRLVRGEIAEGITITISEDQGCEKELELSGLEALCLGLVTPLASFAIPGGIESTIQWTVQDLEAKKILWKAYKQAVYSGFNHKKGAYFEFAVRETGRLIFVDCKDKPAYLV